MTKERKKLEGSEWMIKDQEVYCFSQQAGWLSCGIILVAPVVSCIEFWKNVGRSLALFFSPGPFQNFHHINMERKYC